MGVTMKEDMSDIHGDVVSLCADNSVVIQLCRYDNIEEGM